MTEAAILKLTQLIQVATMASTAIDVANNLWAAADKVSAMLKTAHAEGREITDAELDSVVVDDDDAKRALDAHIAARKAAG